MGRLVGGTIIVVLTVIVLIVLGPLLLVLLGVGLYEARWIIAIGGVALAYVCVRAAMDDYTTRREQLKNRLVIVQRSKRRE